MKQFLRIGAAAKFCGVRKSTIRHYTDMGILSTAGQTPAGHRLYDARKTMVRVQLIRSASARRASLKDVKGKLK
ncbi:MAG: MerR family DNA-binding transcriptional regulator [Elusimicrobiota bacterium]|nr:MerR family DNA-binding transcriptional regulator [Elusimicrobiota bacterium]